MAWLICEAARARRGVYTLRACAPSPASALPPSEISAPT